jgi:hypothetical protein
MQAIRQTWAKSVPTLLTFVKQLASWADKSLLFVCALALATVLGIDLRSTRYAQQNALAQAPIADSNSDHRSEEVPDRLRYIFELPWCKAWLFRCTRCEKQNDSIVCERLTESCEENFSVFRCRAFDVAGPK